MVIKRLTQVTADYAEGIIHGKDGVSFIQNGDAMKSMKISVLYGLIMN